MTQIKTERSRLHQNTEDIDSPSDYLKPSTRQKNSEVKKTSKNGKKW